RTVTSHFTPTLRRRAYCKFILTAPIRTLRARNRAMILPTTRTSAAAITLGRYANRRITNREVSVISKAEILMRNPTRMTVHAIARVTRSVGLFDGDHCASVEKPH